MMFVRLPSNFVPVEGYQCRGGQIPADSKVFVRLAKDFLVLTTFVLFVVTALGEIPAVISYPL